MLRRALNWWWSETLPEIIASLLPHKVKFYCYMQYEESGKLMHWKI